MAAYVIVDIGVNDPNRYTEYMKLVPQAVAAYGGKYLARGGKVEVFEGDWLPKRLVIIEFENIATARRWLESPEYRQARKIRHETSTSNMVVVEGL